MKTELLNTYNVPAFMLPAIINGDVSGMENREIEKMELWIDEINTLVERLGFSYCTFEVISEEPFFTYRDDVLNTGADCYEVNVIMFER